MCQANVYLNDEVIMRDVMIVEPVPEGIRLIVWCTVEVYASDRWRRRQGPHS